MFENDKMYIKEIQSVILIQNRPNKTPKKSKFGPLVSRYELVYMISSENITIFNGKLMHNVPGSVEYLPKCNKADYIVERLQFGECIDIFFDTDCKMPETALSFDFSKKARLSELFKKIYMLWINKNDGYYQRCMSIFYEILYEISKPAGEYLPLDKYKKIQKGIEYLNNNCLNADIDYYAPATLCNMSYTYFKRLFIQKFGIPPIKYVTKLRLDRSIELLNIGRNTITETASLCGFENVYYFSKKFKEEYGVSPREYKNNSLLLELPPENSEL